MAYIWILISAFSFATMGALAHALRGDVDWQIVALVRALVTLLAFGGSAMVAGVRLRFWKPKDLWMRSVPGSVGMVCTFFALAKLPVSVVITLTNLSPIWIALLSWPLLRQRPRRGVWLAVLVGVVGVAMVQQPQLARGNYAVLVAVAGSFSIALAMIGLNRLKDQDTRVVVFHFSVVASLFLLATLAFSDGWSFSRTAMLDGRIVVMLLGVGGAATVGQLFLTLAFAAGPPSEVAVVGLTQVVFAFGYDTWISGHAFDRITLTGMILVIAPTAWLLATVRRRIAEGTES